MHLTWLIQCWMNPTRCALCRQPIPNWTIYFRATFEPDTADAMGYDVCAGCRAKQPSEPNPNPVPTF